jgi:hypothetical protein
MSTAKDSGNDEVLDLDDDELEAVEDDPIHWIKWTEPTTVDLEVVGFPPDGGRDVEQRPCPELEGVLLRRAGDLNPGELVRITASQVKLARRLKKLDPHPGLRVVIKYVGLVKTSGGTMKDFEVLHGEITPPMTRPISPESPPF